METMEKSLHGKRHTGRLRLTHVVILIPTFDIDCEDGPTEMRERFEEVKG